MRVSEFEERYSKPFPASGKWAAFFTQGTRGAGRETYRIWRDTILRIFGSYSIRAWPRIVNLDNFRQTLRKQQERIINVLPEYRKMRKESTG